MTNEQQDELDFLGIPFIWRHNAMDGADEPGLATALDEIDAEHRMAAAQLLYALRQKDAYVYDHSLRTHALVRALGRHMGIVDSANAGSIRLGSLLHDVGKLFVRRQLLLKPGPLDETEFETMRRHPAIGEMILDLFGAEPVVCQMARHHHERLDGSGYPDRLAGDRIPPYVRLLTVCDCFDALTSHRSYRTAMSPAKAMSILMADAGCGRLDASIVAGLHAFQFSSPALEESELIELLPAA